MTQLYHNQSNMEKVRKLAILQIRFCAILAVTLFVGVWLINGSFIKLWVGGEYYAGDMENLFVAIINGFIVLSIGFKTLLEIQFDFQRVGLTVILEGVIGFITAFVLAYYYGVMGLLFGIMIATISFRLPFIIYKVLIWLNNEDSFLMLIKNLFWLPSIILLVWCIAGDLIHWRPQTWVELIGSSLVVGGLSMSIGLGWIWRDIRYYSVFKGIEAYRTSLIKTLNFKKV